MNVFLEKCYEYLLWNKVCISSAWVYGSCSKNLKVQAKKGSVVSSDGSYIFMYLRKKTLGRYPKKKIDDNTLKYYSCILFAEVASQNINIPAGRNLC